MNKQPKLMWLNVVIAILVLTLGIGVADKLIKSYQADNKQQDTIILNMVNDKFKESRFEYTFEILNDSMIYIERVPCDRAGTTIHIDSFQSWLQQDNL